MKIYTVNGYIYGSNGWRQNYQDISLKDGKWVEGIISYLSTDMKTKLITKDELPYNMREKLERSLEPKTDDFGRTVKFAFDGLIMQIEENECEDCVQGRLAVGIT